MGNVEKVSGSFYPKTSMSNKSFTKSSAVDGVYEISDTELVFKAKAFMAIRVKSKDFKILIKDIDRIELVTLNNVLPFGVCVILENGDEYMLGAIKRKKLKEILDAKIANR